MDSKALTLMIPITILSGAVSGVALMMNSASMQLGPGFFFGLASAAVFLYTKRMNLGQSTIWLLVSMGSWYAAFRLYLAFMGTESYSMLLLVACGVMGSALLTAAYSLLTRKVNPQFAILTIAAGAIGAVGMYFVLLSQNDFNSISLGISFAIWQVMVGTAFSQSGTTR